MGVFTLLTTITFVHLLPFISNALPINGTTIALDNDLDKLLPSAPSPVEAIEKAFIELRKSHRNNAANRAFSGSPSTPPAVQTVRNELLEGKCAQIIIIFARGTTEPGNVGDDVGPSFFDALASLKPGKSIIQGVNNYPAVILDYLLGGSKSGAKNMAQSVAKVAGKCPNSKIVLSGFSQGAQVTHKAADLIPTSQYGLIAGIVLFGDPKKGRAFPGSLNKSVKTFCHKGDYICDGIPIPTEEHMNYENDAPEAAAFVGSLFKN